MALIEGVGDEVTVLFGALVGLLVLALAWFSTRTVEREPPPAAPAATPARAPPEQDSAPHGEPPPQQDAPAWARPASSPPPAADTIVLRLKFLNDTERLARVRPQDTVGDLKRALFPGQEQLVRLIFQGQLLRDDAQMLAALPLTHNSVVHCHILQHRAPPPPMGTHANAANVHAAHAALNVGSLMVPLFVLMLGALWYFQLQYRHVFTATATTCLAGLTLIFSFVAFVVYRR